MIPSKYKFHLELNATPRTRGDDPAAWDLQTALVCYSPHTRG